MFGTPLIEYLLWIVVIAHQVVGQPCPLGDNFFLISENSQNSQLCDGTDIMTTTLEECKTECSQTYASICLGISYQSTLQQCRICHNGITCVTKQT